MKTFYGLLGAVFTALASIAAFAHHFDEAAFFMLWAILCEMRERWAS